MLEYSRLTSQKASNDPSHLSGQRPWTSCHGRYSRDELRVGGNLLVQLSTGPISGCAFQNCVRRKYPPGELVQQVSALLWMSGQ